MSYKPHPSCLTPYADEIIALRRRKPPMPYARIAELMHEKYQITVKRESVYKFVRIQSKGFKLCKYAWNIQQASPEVGSQQQPTISPPVVKPVAPSPTPVRAVTNPPVTPASKSKPKPYFDFQFSEHYNLHRLTPEEVIALHKKLDEEEK